MISLIAPQCQTQHQRQLEAFCQFHKILNSRHNIIFLIYRFLSGIKIKILKRLFCFLQLHCRNLSLIGCSDEFLLPVFTSGSYPRYKGSMSFRICHRHKGEGIFQFYCLSDLFCRINSSIPERSVPGGGGHCLIPDFHDPRLSIC